MSIPALIPVTKTQWWFVAGFVFGIIAVTVIQNFYARRARG